MDKKFNLEHTIRNIVRESVGVSGKDKPEGTPRSFLKPVGVISPPKKEEHPGTKKTATILAQRGEDKVKHGLEVEETIEENSETLKDLKTPTPEYLKKYKEYEDWRAGKRAKPLPDLSKDKGKKDYPTAPPDLSYKGLQQPTLKTLPKKQESSSQGEISSRERSPTEVFKDKLVDLYGGGKDAVERVDRITKTVSGTAPILATGAKGADLIHSIQQYGITNQNTIDKAKEVGAEVGTALVGGAALSKLGKYAAPSLRTKAPTTVEKPSEYDVIPPDKVGRPEADVRKQFRQADQEASKFKPQASKFEAPVRSEPSTKVEPVKVEPVEKPQTASERKAAASMKMDVERTRQSNIAAASREAEQFRRMYPKTAETTTKTKEFVEPKVAVSKGEVIAAEKPKVSPAAREPETFKPSAVDKEPVAKVATAEKTPSPLKFKLAEPEVSKGSLVTTKPEMSIGKFPAAKDKVLQGEIIQPSKQANITIKKQPPVIDLKATDVTSTSKNVAVTVPNMKISGKADSKVGVEPKTFSNIKTAVATATATKTATEKKQDKEENGKKRTRLPFAFPAMHIDGTPLAGMSGIGRGNPYVHTTRQYIKREKVDESADEERRSIENVARPNSDRKKATKQAEIIRKIIEEKKATRKKSTATVDMNPKIKTPEADQ